MLFSQLLRRINRHRYLDNYSKLNIILEYLEKSSSIGSLEQGTPYFKGEMLMHYGPHYNDKDLVVFSGQSENNIVWLGGSTWNLISGVPEKPNLMANNPLHNNGVVFAASGVGKSETLLSLIMALAIDYEPSLLGLMLVDNRGGRTFDSLSEITPPQKSYDEVKEVERLNVLEVVYRDTINQHVPKQRVEFVAKRILAGQVQVVKSDGEASTEPVNVLIGTPLYVALLD